MNTQFIQNGYLGYPVNYNTYPNHYDHFYRRHDRQAGQVSITAGTNGTLITNGQSTTESLTFPPGTPVAAHANIPIGYTFSHWETNVPGIQFMPSAQSEDVTFMMPDQPMTITAVLTPIFHLGEAVKVNPTAQTWATGEIIPTWVHGLEDSIREMRNNGTELLLDALNSWIRASDVIKVTQEAKPTLSTSSVPTESTSPTLTPIGLGDQVKVNQSVQTWATGEGMPAWVYGRVYPVIEMRMRNGVTELLLGNGINSWIRLTDVTKVSEITPTAPIQVGNQVKVNQSVQTWATGEGMPAWVYGRVYPVIEMRMRNGITELLLGNGINSWIRASDVTLI